VFSFASYFIKKQYIPYYTFIHPKYNYCLICLLSVFIRRGRWIEVMFDVVSITGYYLGYKTMQIIFIFIKINQSMSM